MTKTSSRSGPSGKHRTARYLLTLSAEQRAVWEEAAKRDGRTLADWIRRSCDWVAMLHSDKARAYAKKMFGAVADEPRRKTR